jgi:hypothetical protein
MSHELVERGNFRTAQIDPFPLLFAKETKLKSAKSGVFRFRRNFNPPVSSSVGWCAFSEKSIN